MVAVEKESQKLVEALKERYNSEQAYYQKYIEKEQECSKLAAAAMEVHENISSKER